MVNSVCIIGLIFYKKKLNFYKILLHFSNKRFYKRKIILNQLYQNDTSKKLNSFFQNNLVDKMIFLSIFFNKDILRELIIL